MLCYSESAWKTWLNPGSNLNRFRLPDYEKTFKQHFKELVIQVVTRDEEAFITALPRIRPEFLTGDFAIDAVTMIQVMQLFGRVIGQSGAFFDRMVLGTAGACFDRSVLLDLVRLQERLPLEIWMDVGRLEWLLEANQAFYRLLVSRGYQPAYREYSGGHNYTAWRDDLWRGLLHLLGTQP